MHQGAWHRWTPMPPPTYVSARRGLTLQTELIDPAGLVYLVRATSPRGFWGRLFGVPPRRDVFRARAQGDGAWFERLDNGDQIRPGHPYYVALSNRHAMKGWALE